MALPFLTLSRLSVLVTSLTILTGLALLAMKGCGESARDASRERVTIGGKTFNLELALDNAARFRGLSERTDIPADAGMLFVFPDAGVRVQEFVMRDCPNPIDIIYLDRGARVTAMYTMQPEPPRSEAEKVKGSPANDAYENRLKRYSSRYPAQFVIELRGGTIAGLSIKPGDKVNLDAAALKKRAR